MDTFTHKCVKPDCGNTYSDSDPDAYYCPSCQKEKDIKAKELDRKFATRSTRPPMTPLQEYDAAPKGPGGFMIVK